MQKVPSPEDAAAQQAPVVVVVAAGQDGHHVGQVDHPWQCFGLALLPLGLRLSFQSWTERAKDFESNSALAKRQTIIFQANGKEWLNT